jgi:hypothetical protein
MRLITAFYYNLHGSGEMGIKNRIWKTVPFRKTDPNLQTLFLSIKAFFDGAGQQTRLFHYPAHTCYENGGKE